MNTLTQSKTPRNYGIDLLRCISMFMVVIHHILNHGGVLGALSVCSTAYNALSGLEVIAYPAVDIFAMITGYIMVNQKYKVKRIVTLWLEVFFYSIALMAVVSAIQPDLFSLKDAIKSVFPVSFGAYWYFTAYFGMYLFIPFFNELLVGKQAKRLIVSCIVIFSLIPLFPMRDVFGSGWGYSTLWLSVCYLIGGYMRLHIPQERKAGKAIAIYCIAVLFTWASKVVIQLAALKLGIGSGLGYYFLSYTSPFVLIQACALVYIFGGISVKPILRKPLTAAAASAFAVYLLHENMFVKAALIQDKLTGLNEWNCFAEIGMILLLSVAVFVTGICVDFIRIQLFKLLRISDMVDSLCAFVTDKYHHLLKRGN